MNAASAIKTPTPPYTDDIAGYLLSGGKNGSALGVLVFDGERLLK